MNNTLNLTARRLAIILALSLFSDRRCYRNKRARARDPVKAIRARHPRWNFLEFREVRGGDKFSIGLRARRWRIDRLVSLEVVVRESRLRCGVPARSTKQTTETGVISDPRCIDAGRRTFQLENWNVRPPIDEFF